MKFGQYGYSSGRDVDHALVPLKWTSDSHASLKGLNVFIHETSLPDLTYFWISFLHSISSLSVLGTAVMMICILPLVLSANVMTGLLKCRLFFLSLLSVYCQNLLCLLSSVVLSSVYLHYGTEVTVNVFQQDPLLCLFGYTSIVCFIICSVATEM